MVSLVRTFILIRNPATGLYLAGRDQWTAKRSEARAFYRGGEAIAHALAHGLGTVRFEYAFCDARYGFALHPWHSRSGTSPGNML